MTTPEKDIGWLLKEKYDGEKTPEFYADCKRLALGEPVAYLIGWTPFLNTKIHLDSKPLIPRPETEYWVEKVIAGMNTSTDSLGFGQEPVRVLDLCAGSGCIGVAVAKAVDDSLVDFAEIDTSHLATIEKNLKENDIDESRVTITHSNLFEKIEARYDFILSNPPYIDADLNRVDESVTMHEPYLALFGGRGGLDIIKDIIATAPAHLRQTGQLWLEHEPEQSADIAKLAEQYGFTCETHTDQFKNERYSVLVLQ